MADRPATQVAAGFVGEHRAMKRETTNAKGSVSAYRAGREDAMPNQPVRQRPHLLWATDLIEERISAAEEAGRARRSSTAPRHAPGAGVATVVAVFEDAVNRGGGGLQAAVVVPFEPRG